MSRCYARYQLPGDSIVLPRPLPIALRVDLGASVMADGGSRAAHGGSCRRMSRRVARGFGAVESRDKLSIVKPASRSPCLPSYPNLVSSDFAGRAAHSSGSLDTRPASAASDTERDIRPLQNPAESENHRKMPCARLARCRQTGWSQSPSPPSAASSMLRLRRRRR